MKALDMIQGMETTDKEKETVIYTDSKITLDSLKNKLRMGTL